MMRRKLLGITGAGLAGVLALAACSPADDPGDDDDNGATDLGWEACEDDPDACHTGPVSDEGGQFTMMISLPFEGWTQLRAGSNSVYVLQAVDGIWPDQSGFLPSGEWEWDLDFYEEEPQVVEEDPQTMVYQIREEAVWHDGTPVTYKDFKYNWYNSAGEDAGFCDGCEPPSTAGWGQVESVEGSDGGKTVTVTLKDGQRSPEWFASYGPYVPAHVAEEQGFDWENNPEEMGESTVWFDETMPEWSGGPWRIESGTLTERVVKVPNENYWGDQPHLDRIIGEVVPEPGAWVPAIRNRDIDGGSPATFDVDVFLDLQTVDNVHYAAGSAGAVWENMTLNLDNEFFADPALREAIFTAINMEHGSNAIWGDDVPVNQRLNHTFSQLSPYFEDFRTDSGFGSGDINAAQAILDAAGYTGQEEGGTLTTPDGDVVENLRYRWTAGDTNRAAFGELMQEYLSGLGITVELDSSEDLGGMLSAGDFDIAAFGWSGSPAFVNSLAQLWGTGSDSNYSGLENTQIDELAAEAARQVDLDDAAVLANQLSEVLMNEAVVLPMWDSPNFDFISDDYVNMRPNHNSSARLWYNQADWGMVAN